MGKKVKLQCKVNKKKDTSGEMEDLEVQRLIESVEN
jgi:hypothetical protein